MVQFANKAAKKSLGINVGIAVAITAICFGLLMAIATTCGWMENASAVTDSPETSMTFSDSQSTNSDKIEVQNNEESTIDNQASEILSAEYSETAEKAAAGAAQKESNSPVEKNEIPSSPQNIRTCTISIECKDILNNFEKLSPTKISLIPSNGLILNASNIPLTEGDSVFSILQKACSEAKIPLDYSSNLLGGSCYVEGLNNLYEFDCGPESGWTYTVNSKLVNRSCSDCLVNDKDVIIWSYKCSL